MTHTYNLSYSRGRDEDLSSKIAQAHSFETLSRKYPTHTKKRAGRVAQVVEHLPSYCKALSFPSTAPSPKKIPLFRRF
jgi:hypothetical protein